MKLVSRRLPGSQEDAVHHLNVQGVAEYVVSIDTNHQDREYSRLRLEWTCLVLLRMPDTHSWVLEDVKHRERQRRLL